MITSAAGMRISSRRVSGMLGTQRITMNDNLLNRTSLPEIEAVMGHELGHYVLDHMYKLLVFFTIVIALAFMVLHRGFDWTHAHTDINAVEGGRSSPLTYLEFDRVIRGIAGGSAHGVTTQNYNSV